MSDIEDIMDVNVEDLSPEQATAAGCRGSIPTEVFAIIQEEQKRRPIHKK
jgi:hypothetical protein